MSVLWRTVGDNRPTVQPIARSTPRGARMLTTQPRTRRFARSEPDERLVERVRAGDREAFEEVYERHASGLVSFCRHLLGNMEEAEDAVQHTFLAAHRAMLADDRELHLKAWLYTIARNRCLSMLRGRRERPGLDDELEHGLSTAGLAVEVEHREDLRALLADLAHLPHDQRAALLLAELGAHTHDEIAQVLDVRRDKVKALVFQAREGLIAAREARETPCREIREQLATARGAALRRGNLRRHLDVCAGCRAFREDVQHQRAALAILLPVVPSLALKHAVLGGATAGAAGFGGGAAAGGAKAIATKVLAAAALAGGAGGTGYVAVHELHHPVRLPALSASAGPTQLLRPHTRPVALRVVRTPSVSATPLRAPRVHHARAVHHRRAHKAAAHHRRAPARRAVAPAPPAATVVRHHARRHARPPGRAPRGRPAPPPPRPAGVSPPPPPPPARHAGRGRGREAHAPPAPIAQGPQVATPAPAPADDGDDQGDDEDDQGDE